MRGFQGRFKRTDRGRMADRNRELVPDNWSLVRGRALNFVRKVGILNTWVCAEEPGCREGV